MADQAEELRKLFRNKNQTTAAWAVGSGNGGLDTGDGSVTLTGPVVPQIHLPRLQEIKRHLLKGAQFQRGDDGLEVPTYVLPLTPVEALFIVNELIARRLKHGE